MKTQEATDGAQNN